MRREEDDGHDIQAVDSALGAWSDREIDGETYIDDVRSGDRLRDMQNGDLGAVWRS